jgi:hypothetical protein
MSGFIGAAAFSGSVPLLAPGWGQNKDIIDPVQYRRAIPGVYGAWPEIVVDALWPRSNFAPSSGNPIISPAPQLWEWNLPPTGSHVLKVVSGLIYDENNNPVSGATVKLFNTSTGVLVDTQTTASDGSYRCGDPNAVACFLVVYKAGSPDISGTSLNTVLGV